jgi:hypothetical protein
MTTTDEAIVFEFEKEDYDSETEEKPQQQQYSSYKSDQELAAEKIQAEKLARIEEQLKRDQEVQEERRKAYIFEQFESKYAHIDPDQKLYMKELLSLHTNLTNKQLQERDAKIEELNNKLALNEIYAQKVHQELTSLNYTTKIDKICKLALSEHLEASFPKGVKNQHIEFARSEYELRYRTDDTFRSRVDNLINDTKLKPAQIDNKLAALIAKNTEKAYVEKYAKKGKDGKDITRVAVEIEEDKKPAKPAAAEEPKTTPAKKEGTTTKELSDKEIFDLMFRGGKI